MDGEQKTLSIFIVTMGLLIMVGLVGGMVSNYNLVKHRLVYGYQETMVAGRQAPVWTKVVNDSLLQKGQ